MAEERAAISRPAEERESLYSLPSAPTFSVALYLDIRFAGVVSLASFPFAGVVSMTSFCSPHFFLLAMLWPVNNTTINLGLLFLSLLFLLWLFSLLLFSSLLLFLYCFYCLRRLPQTVTATPTALTTVTTATTTTAPTTATTTTATMTTTVLALVVSADEHTAASDDDGIPADERADQRKRPRITRWIAGQGPWTEPSRGGGNGG